MRVARTDARVHMLSPIAVGPAVEAAFAHRGQIIGHEVGAELVALVHHRPQLAGFGAEGERSGIAKAGGIAFVHPGLRVDLPHHGTIDFGRQTALGKVAVRADADE